MREMRRAIHDLRTDRVAAPGRRQARRHPGGVRSRQARVGGPQGFDPSSRSGGGRRACRRPDRGRVARERFERSLVVGDRPPGYGQASSARPDRLHPLRQRIPELRRPRGPQARGGQPVCPARERSHGQMSVLSDRDIAAALAAGRVRVEPYDKTDLQPSSIDLHLDRSFRVFRNNRYPYIDVRAPQAALTDLLNVTDDEPFVLHPSEFVLGQTLEWVELPDDLVARLEGKSSLGRLGLLIHSTAGYVDPGWKGKLTLELSNVAKLPIALYFGMKIGQISFLTMSSPVDRPYGSKGLGSKYQGESEPTASGFLEFLYVGRGDPPAPEPSSR